jgi:ATP-dependent Zn protease
MAWESDLVNPFQTPQCTGLWNNTTVSLAVQAAIQSTAYHEAGHALVALYTPGADQLHKATINPRGEALGLTWQIPPSDEHSSSLTQMRARIDVAMGGTVAECIAFGQERVGIGATSDLRAATDTARFLVCDCGFSDKIGPMKIDEKTSSIQRHAADMEVLHSALYIIFFPRVNAYFACEDSVLSR